MRAFAVVPVKRFAAAKQRLSDGLPAEGRQELAAAMLSDVLAAIRRSRFVARTVVVTGEPAACRAAQELGVDWVDDPEDAGHSQAAARGVEIALKTGSDCAALLPGDCPLLDPGELDAALEKMAPGTVAVVPDRHGSGTNGLLLAPPDAIVPAFGPGSRERHLRLAADAGVEGRVAEIPSLALDLDTPEDLAALRAELHGAPERAPETARALRGMGG